MDSKSWMKAMMPKMKSMGNAQPAWKIQIARRNSFPRVLAVGAVGAAPRTSLAVAVPVADSLAGCDKSGVVAMILTKFYPEGNRKNFQRENRVRKRGYEMWT